MLHLIWVAVLAVAGATFVVYTAFLSLSSVKRVLAAGIKLPVGMRLTCYVLLLIGWPADVLYNWTVGTWRFREAPKEWTYSVRVQRHWRKHGTDRRGRVADYWAGLLNAADPDHVHEPRE